MCASRAHIPGEGVYHSLVISSPHPDRARMRDPTSPFGRGAHAARPRHCCHDRDWRPGLLARNGNTVPRILMFQCQLWNGLSNLWVVYVADAQQPDNANSNTKIGGSKAHRKGLLLQPPFSRRFVGDIERRQLMKAKEAMHKGVEWVSPDTPLIAIAKKMLEQDIGAVPIGENDRLIGMVTDRDIALRAVANGKDVSRLTARDVMTEGIVWCRDIDEVNQAADVMQTRQVRRLPVIDQNKRMIGILSLGDISHSASKRTAAEVARGVSAHHA